MDITTSEIPREVADIIVDLNVIGRIPTNHKLNTLNKTYVDADSRVDALWRMWNGETGDSTVDFINATIDTAIEICRKNPSWTEHIAGCVSTLSNALLNLEHIYRRKKQESTVGKIELIKIRINKERFLRACQTAKSTPISISQPLIPISMSPTVHTGLTPILTNTTPNLFTLYQEEQINIIPPDKKE
jgi:hypothetical protein